MEPENRPYVGPETKPGDAGTEEWADAEPGSGSLGRGPLANPDASDEDGIVDGSPADEFVHDPKAIHARDDQA